METPSTVLAVALATEQPSTESLRRIEHEDSVASELDPAWAAQPLALTRHEGRMILMLKDPGGEPLDRILERNPGQPLDLTRFLQMALGLAKALGQAHRRGLNHKDIKPANVLVDDTGNVWLTGFGLASRLPRTPHAPAASEAGTLGYMAPEQTGLIPELEFILGKQPPVADLPPREAQNRFQLVFRRFPGAFAHPEQPLALFLDDLQWLDAATLDLLERLVTQTVQSSTSMLLRVRRTPRQATSNFWVS